MISSLNPKRYRVEHLHDLDEAILRGELVLAHALVLHDSCRELSPEALVKRLRTTAERLALVCVSDDVAMRDVAAMLGGRYVGEPYAVPELKRAVYRAVSKSEQRRHGQNLQERDSSAETVQRVMLLSARASTGSVMAAVLSRELGVVCEVATAGHAAMEILQAPVHCTVADVSLLLDGHEGAAVARELARRGIPVIPLSKESAQDVSDAGQAAWAVVPQVRRSLMARADQLGGRMG